MNLDCRLYNLILSTLRLRLPSLRYDIMPPEPLEIEQPAEAAPEGHEIDTLWGRWKQWLQINAPWVNPFLAIVALVVTSVGIILATSLSLLLLPGNDPAPLQPQTTPMPTSLRPTFSPTEAPSESPTTLTPHLQECRNLCEGITGTPVMANGVDLRRTILQYRQNPDSSPHGNAIGCWNVSGVINMDYIFASGASSADTYPSDLEDPTFTNFDEDLSCWDTRKVVSMKGVFAGNPTFDQDISSWQLSNVIDTSFMFIGATSFNRNLSGWEVGSVVTMRAMFYLAENFNGDVQSWDVSSVEDFYAMFQQAYSFNQPLVDWDVRNVQDMSYMFHHAHAFNQPLQTWSPKAATSLVSMFLSARAFDQDLCNWKVWVDVDSAEMGDLFGDTSCPDSSTPTSFFSSWCHACNNSI